ncbi:MAG: hypothetical protein ACKON8_07000 [Planctomycetota bacterium]
MDDTDGIAPPGHGDDVASADGTQRFCQRGVVHRADRRGDRPAFVVVPDHELAAGEIRQGIHDGRRERDAGAVERRHDPLPAVTGGHDGGPGGQPGREGDVGEHRREHEAHDRPDELCRERASGKRHGNLVRASTGRSIVAGGRGAGCQGFVC